MRSIIVLALGLFATQTVGVHLAANANAADYYGIDQCSHDLARAFIKEKFGEYYYVDWDDFKKHVNGLVGDTLTRGEADKMLNELESKVDDTEISGTPIAKKIEDMGNAKAKATFHLSHSC